MIHRTGWVACLRVYGCLAIPDDKWAATHFFFVLISLRLRGLNNRIMKNIWWTLPISIWAVLILGGAIFAYSSLPPESRSFSCDITRENLKGNWKAVKVVGETKNGDKFSVLEEGDSLKLLMRDSVFSFKAQIKNSLLLSVYFGVSEALPLSYGIRGNMVVGNYSILFTTSFRVISLTKNKLVIKTTKLYDDTLPEVAPLADIEPLYCRIEFVRE